MKCPICKGKTEYFKEVFNDGKQRREILVECNMCHGSGEVEMTNEEWLHTLNTEEKALFLARLYGHSRKIDLPELLFRNVGTREVTDVAEYIGKWLKEKHESEENDVSVR